MVIKFFHLVLKKYRKSFWKMCVSPDFDISYFCFFSVYFACFSGKVTIHWQLPGVTISWYVWSKNRFFLVQKKLKNRVVNINQTHYGVMEPEPKFPALGPAEGIHSHWLQIRLQHAKVFGSRSRMIWSQKHWKPMQYLFNS